MITDENNILFDLDQLKLYAVYTDELALYRAKKKWCQVLADSFLLTPEDDFNIKTKRQEVHSLLLECTFISSCARYAFWRITNNHVPEATYQLEVAHIPGL